MKKSFFSAALAFVLFTAALFSSCSLNSGAISSNSSDFIESNRSDSSLEGDSSTEKTDIEELLSGRIPYSEKYDGYTPSRAEYEEEELSLWFDHTYTRTAAEETKPNERVTYRMTLAKNEAEACQILLSSKIERKGLIAELTEFENVSGKVLRTEIFEGYYFNVEGREIVDPLPPYAGTFNLSAGRSKTFFVKTYAAAEDEPGEYKALLRIKDGRGREIKRASLFAYVWNFVLPEKTSCKTLMDLSRHNIYSYHKCYEGDDGKLYAAYYDYLLENRICPYTLPYNMADGSYSDKRIEKYLDNPRVVAFLNLGWKTFLNADNLRRSFRNLSKNPQWLKKAYFYPVDEPTNVEDLEKIRFQAKLIKRYYSEEYKLLAPMHINVALDKDNGVDFFSYVEDSVTAWCAHTYFFNTYAEYLKNPELTYWMTKELEQSLGTFPKRMEREKADGDEVWWYVTHTPAYPEITLTMESPAVNYRIIFWQQKLYGVDNFLYYLTNDWHGNGADYGWNPKYETWNDACISYGNGVLIYCGAFMNINGPVGSLRLECVRDGIEDFEYLSLLEQRYDKATMKGILNLLTTSLGCYKTDEEYFTHLRESLGVLAEKVMNE